MERRNFHGVDVAIRREASFVGSRSVLVLPDREIEVNERAYANRDEAAAAHVAVWRMRRVRTGVDAPERRQPTARDCFEQAREDQS